MSESAAAQKVQIQNGPFAGRGPLPTEVRPLLDRSGQPVLRDGKIVDVWGVHHRTRHFLELFKPSEGWSLVIEQVPGPFNIPDPETWVSNGNGGQVMALQPTALFTGKVTDPSGKVIATASTLKVINGESAWERGETKVRSRLYDALGLTTSLDVEEIPPETSQAANAPKPALSIAGVTAVVAPINREKLPATAKQLIGEKSAASTGTDPSTPSSFTDSAAEPAASTVIAPKVESAPTPVAAKNESTEQDPAVVLNQNLLRQASQRARINNVAIPKFTSNEHLQEFYKSLLKKAS